MCVGTVDDYRHGQVSGAHVASTIITGVFVQALLIMLMKEVLKKGERYVVRPIAKALGVKGKEKPEHEKFEKDATDYAFQYATEVVGNVPFIGGVAALGMQKSYYYMRYNTQMSQPVSTRTNILSGLLDRGEMVVQSFMTGIKDAMEGKMVEEGPLEGRSKLFYDSIDLIGNIVATMNYQAGSIYKHMTPQLKEANRNYYYDMFYDAVKKNDKDRAVFAAKMLRDWFNVNKRDLITTQRKLSDKDRELILEEIE